MHGSALGKAGLGNPSYGVRELGLLRNPREAAFQRLVHLARRLMSAPVATVSIFDPESERVFLKAQSGFERIARQASEMSVRPRFCSSLIEANDMIVIEDSAAEPASSETVAARTMGVGAFLGIPISDPHGRPVGALCVADPRPRRWTDGDYASGVALAAMGTDQILLRASLKTLEIITRRPRSAAG